LFEIQQECLNLQNKIDELCERRNTMLKHGDLDFKIKLFEYKLACLSEVSLNKVNSKEDLETSTIEKVLLKNIK